jgi:hypothetical protein
VNGGDIKLLTKTTQTDAEDDTDLSVETFMTGTE